MAEQQIADMSTSAAPLTRTTKDSEQFELLAVSATFNGASATSGFLPCVEVVSDAGVLVARHVTGSTVAAGGSADVTFAPFLGRTGGGVGFGGTILLYDYTVAGADKASIDTAVDGPMAGLFRTDLTYLEVYLTARTDEAIFVSDVNIFFNNDTASTSYTRDFIASAAAGSPIQGQVTAGATFTGVVAGASAAASIPGLMRLFIPNYSTTAFFKICEFTAWSVDSVAGLTHYQIGLEAALWRNLAAVTRIMMTPELAGKKFKVGSRLSVWAR